MTTLVISLVIFSFCGYIVVKGIAKRLKGEKSCGCGGGCAGCGTTCMPTLEDKEV